MMQACAVARPFTPVAAAAAAPRRQRLVSVQAGQGFASSKPSPKPKEGGSSKKQSKLARYLDAEVAVPAGQAGSGLGGDWIEMPGVDTETTFLSKPIKALILATGRAVCLYKVDGQVYATDANSTAYQYPLADANILAVKGKAAVESPLDGTVYELATGKVLSWCPKTNLTRKILGALKDKSEPVDLPVYPVQVKDGKIYVKFAK
ncbi:Rieske (2Fe-2S) region [Micractinium conductrix]|uniref:Rieske (2Fe-2S) region n=1 Tax=Micractinium conductrix TaxID=554055 RepID=A0A2P6VCU9_9CHLO|nr:Rieske (2Fe-2S) region [Micractinium conductrix]|eukprot:PSC71881.1 Rieske (2Fe-2S) region [Micractinium conductrix]